MTTYEDMIPSPIENARVQKSFRDGVQRSYFITPNSGYVLHDSGRDWTDIDPETGEEVVYRGYTRGTATCGANYDFVANPREFYAIPESEAPADQIFGGANNDHEVM